jgi:hypothetical protein
VTKTNRRNKEFAEEVKELFYRIWARAEKEAKEMHVSEYDIEIDFKDILKEHMTYRMIATEACAMRHFENLLNRNLLLVSEKQGRKIIKMNPAFAGQDVNLMVGIFVMPSNKPK